MESSLAGKVRACVSCRCTSYYQRWGASPKPPGSSSETQPGVTLLTTPTKLRNTSPQDVTDRTSYHGFNRPLENP